MRADPLDLLYTVPDVVIQPVRHHVKAHFLQRVQRFRVGLVFLRRVLDVVDDQVQLPLGGDLRVLLAERAGGAVAGICQKRLALDLKAAVEHLKGLLRHIDLAADDDALRRVLQLLRQGADRAQILRDVLARLSVPAGGAAEELPAAVFHGDGKPVDLRLHVILLLAVDRAVHAFSESKQLLVRKHVHEALQRNLVLDGRELAADLAADMLRRGIRRQKLRKLVFQIHQRVDQLIIFKIGDRRRVLVVIAAGMLLHLRAQRKDLLSRFICFHGFPP